MRPWFLSLLLLLAVSTVGDVVLAATCTPIVRGRVTPVGTATA
jgi:hypothetical protein